MSKQRADKSPLTPPLANALLRRFIGKEVGHRRANGGKENITPMGIGVDLGFMTD
ncbi:MAG: hypothetical protein JKY52_03695 [Flavobacteriales bacterium]|nr:hypothetical protein [Flavobacteriales bacterium]